MKNEADKFKAQLSYTTDSLNSNLDDIINDDKPVEEKLKKQKTKVSFNDKKTKDEEA
jgi:hypothetical protein